MRPAVAFTLRLPRSWKRQHITGEVSISRACGHEDFEIVSTPHTTLLFWYCFLSPPCFLSCLCAFARLSPLLLRLHAVALCCSALRGSHTAGVFVGVSPCDDLMWAVREHPIVSIWCSLQLQNSQHCSAAALKLFYVNTTEHYEVACTHSSLLPNTFFILSSIDFLVVHVKTHK